jgi:hypothetical protein
MKQSYKSYYEILDEKYWITRAPHDMRKQEELQTLRVVLLMGLGFLFWGLSGVPNIHFAKILNLIGWGFAVWCLYVVIRNPMFLKRSR